MASILRLATASQAGGRSAARMRACIPKQASEQVISGEYEKREDTAWQPLVFGTRNRNRTCNYPLGGGYYIHLTMQACY